jgi:hypothetical protein
MLRPLLSISLIVFLTAGPAVAQELTELSISDSDAARATLFGGYGGHGVDWEMAADSRALGGVLRVRAFVGQGRWVGGIDTQPPAGLDPTVTRTGVLVMLSERADYSSSLKAYGGLGFAVYLPRRADMNAHFGTRITLGLEAQGDGWSIGPELQIDVPRPRFFSNGGPVKDVVDSLSPPGKHLMPTGRIGIAVRKRF